MVRNCEGLISQLAEAVFASASLLFEATTGFGANVILLQ